VADLNNFWRTTLGRN